MPVALGVNGGVLGSNNLPSSGSAKGIWTPNEIARAVALGFWPANYARSITESATGSDAFTVGATPDPYFEYTTLLLPGNGTNGAQNNTFLDGSTNNFTITRNGNTTQGTFSPFSQTGWGNYFAGSQSISIAATASLQYSGDFTIECWFYKPATGDATTFIQQITNYFALNVNPGTGINIYLNSASANFVITDRVPQINTWHHIALVRSGSGSGNIKCYLDGVASSTTATNTSTLGYNAIGYLGAIGTSAGGSLVGYISNFRIVSGRAVYTSNFTPPALPLTRTTGGTNPPQGSETIWLTAQSNRFLDSNGVNTPASSPLTITPNGSPTVVAFSPFNPTASWSAATYGGSGYFDGSADYLTGPNNAAFNFGTGDFCVEFFVYPNDLNFRIYLSSADNSGTQIGYDPGNGPRYLYFYNSTAVFTGQAGTFAPNQWNHLALCRSGTTLSFYCNGARIYTNASYSSNVGFTTPYIGEYNLLGYPFLGYISNLRMVKGASVYTPSSTTLTVPTAPLTAITNTSLLLNFTNAGIYDATSKNDLETVGNAQISTTQSKWGGSSMSFDGTGDYLLAPVDANPYYNFGTGDFTVECWFYANSLSATDYAALLGCNNAGAGNNEWAAYVRSNGIFFYGSSGTLTGVAGTINTGTWYHYAASRSGNTLRIFLNGTQTTSATVTGSYTNSAVGLRVGDDPVGSNPAFNGYLQDVRVTKGYARYTANFTAPTAAFPTL